jgi:hypothetical protein
VTFDRRGLDEGARRIARQAIYELFYDLDGRLNLHQPAAQQTFDAHMARYQDPTFQTFRLNQDPTFQTFRLNQPVKLKITHDAVRDDLMKRVVGFDGAIFHPNKETNTVHDETPPQPKKLSKAKARDQLDAAATRYAKAQSSLKQASVASNQAQTFHLDAARESDEASMAYLEARADYDRAYGIIS